MKILVIGGMHGNEPLGLSVVQLFKKSPRGNVDAVFANEKAIKANCRFIKQDLNRSFPGNLKGKDYEKKRAGELLKLCQKYDLVLDFHNTYCLKNDCTFIGESANKFLFNISSYIGLRRVIVADYDCINKYTPNCISVEISLSSKLNNAKIWYQKISKLALLISVPKQASVTRYKFVYRITLADRDNFFLTKKNLKAFKKIDQNLAIKMGIKDAAYPIFIGDSFTPYNYGALLNKLK